MRVVSHILSYTSVIYNKLLHFPKSSHPSYNDGKYVSDICDYILIDDTCTHENAASGNLFVSS